MAEGLTICSLLPFAPGLQEQRCQTLSRARHPPLAPALVCFPVAMTTHQSLRNLRKKVSSIHGFEGQEIQDWATTSGGVFIAGWKSIGSLGDSGCHIEERLSSLSGLSSFYKAIRLGPHLRSRLLLITSQKSPPPNNTSGLSF